MCSFMCSFTVWESPSHCSRQLGSVASCNWHIRLSPQLLTFEHFWAQRKCTILFHTSLCPKASCWAVTTTFLFTSAKWRRQLCKLPVTEHVQNQVHSPLPEFLERQTTPHCAFKPRCVMRMVVSSNLTFPHVPSSQILSSYCVQPLLFHLPTGGGWCNQLSCFGRTFQSSHTCCSITNQIFFVLGRLWLRMRGNPSHRWLLGVIMESLTIRSDFKLTCTYDSNWYLISSPI